MMTAPPTKHDPEYQGGGNLPQTSASNSQVPVQPSEQLGFPLALSSRAIFWSPRYVAPSTGLVHLPLLFWLVEASAPTAIAQIGLQDGTSFMAMCQAVDKLGLDAACLAVDTARADTKAEPSKAGEKVRSAHSGLYADFSVIVSEDMGTAARHMRGARIDLLVIDAKLDAAALAALHAQWLPLLSDRAVLVINAPEKNLQSAELQEFRASLLRDHPSIGFPHVEPGLDIILIGNNQSDRLLRLAGMDLGSPGYLNVRNVFRSIGKGVEAAQLARSKSTALQKATAEVQELETRLAKVDATNQKNRETISSLEKIEQEQATENAILQARIFDLNRQLEDHRGATAIGAELSRLTGMLEARDADIARLRNEVDSAVARAAARDSDCHKLDRELADWQDREATRQKDAETARLRGMEKARARDAQHAEELAARDRTIAELKKTLVQREEAVAQIDKQLAIRNNDAASLQKRAEEATGRTTAAEAELASIRALLDESRLGQKEVLKRH